MRAIVLAAACSGFLAGCGGKNEYVPPPPPEVTVSTPTVEKKIQYAEFTGRTRESALVDVRARVKGYLESMHFNEGDVVQKGALLYRIDQREFEARLQEAKAAVEVAEAGQALAEARARRMEEAVQKNAVSVLDKLQADAELRQAKAAVQASQAELETARLDMEYTEIHAPITGRISRTRVDPGNLVGAGESTLLATIRQLDPIDVYFDINERALLELMAATSKEEVTTPEERLEELRRIPLELGLSDEEGYPHEGNLYAPESGLDPGTGTLLVWGRLSNPYPSRIVPGLSARVRMPLSEEAQEVILIPERALGLDQSGRFVLVVKDDDVVEQRSVEIGQKAGPMRVIVSGLKPDDRVIINGMLRARPGAKVSPQQADTETPESSETAEGPEASEEEAGASEAPKKPAEETSSN